jgi:hypothetical protein
VSFDGLDRKMSGVVRGLRTGRKKTGRKKTGRKKDDLDGFSGAGRRRR